MEGRQLPLNRLSDEAVIYLFSEQLPALLDERPELEPRIYHAFWKTFARKEEIAAIMDELSEFRTETQDNFERVDQRFEQMDQRFEQVDQRFEQVDQRFETFSAETQTNFDRVDQRFTELETRMEAGFRQVQQAIDRLGSRWGIRNESIFRQTIAELLEKSFGVQVQQRHIKGEQFDCITFDGQHILVEITASANRDIQQTLERKRELYTQATSVTPARVILATASIHSRRAQALRKAGFEVIEPEEDT